MSASASVRPRGPGRDTVMRRATARPPRSGGQRARAHGEPLHAHAQIEAGNGARRGVRSKAGADSAAPSSAAAQDDAVGVWKVERSDVERADPTSDDSRVSEQERVALSA